MESEKFVKRHQWNVPQWNADHGEEKKQIKK